jgi:hypothetical protein
VLAKFPKWSSLALLLFTVSALAAQEADAQEQQPSLGEVARQARKDKEKNAVAPKKVITDETLATSKDFNGIGDVASSQGSSDAMARGLAGLDRVDAILNKLDPMDRASLAKAALLDNNVDFPNRAAWEDQLYEAKQTYVAHGRELTRQMRKILADAQSLKAQPGQDKPNPSDPRVQEMVHRIQDLVQDAVRTDAAYQAVVMEGWDRAKAAKQQAAAR